MSDFIDLKQVLADPDNLPDDWFLSGKGATLPLSPSEGDLFLHIPEGRAVLYQYVASSWQPIKSYGGMVLYVDPDEGVDVPSKGTGVGTDAFATLQYAVNTIPGLVGGNVTINIANTVLNETVVVEGKNFSGDYRIFINGTLISIDTGTTSGSNISGWAQDDTTLNDTGKSWSEDMHKNKILQITGGAGYSEDSLADNFYIIDSNSVNQIKLVGRWRNGTPDTTTTYAIVDWGTEINGGTGVPLTIRGQQGVLIQQIKAYSSSSMDINVAARSNVTINRCWCSGVRVNCQTSTQTSVNTSLFTGDNISFLTKSICNITHCKFHSPTTSSGLLVLTGGDVDLVDSLITERRMTINRFGIVWRMMNTRISGTIGIGIEVQTGILSLRDGCSIAGGSSHGIHVIENGVLRREGGSPVAQINNNGGWGVRIERGSVGMGVSGFSYSNNSSGTFSADATSFGVAT